MPLASNSRPELGQCCCPPSIDHHSPTGQVVSAWAETGSCARVSRSRELRAQIWPGALSAFLGVLRCFVGFSEFQSAARENVLGILRPFLADLPVLPIPATKAQVTVFMFP